VRPVKSGGGPPQSKTLARELMTVELREASWSAPVLWRFGEGDATALRLMIFWTTCRSNPGLMDGIPLGFSATKIPSSRFTTTHQ
jgi:hypothetical protein